MGREGRKATWQAADGRWGIPSQEGPSPFLWQGNGDQWRPSIPMLLCFMLILPPFPISVLPVLSPSFVSHSALVFHTSSSLFYLLGSFLPSHFPCLGNLMFFTVEKNVFLFMLRIRAISLPELPRFSPKPASTAPERPTSSTGVSCSGRRAPPETPPQVLAGDAWLVGVQWAAWELCSQSASTQAVSLEWWARAPEEPQLLRFPDVRAKRWFVSLRWKLMEMQWWALKPVHIPSY